jgi:uncharacterized protein YjbI with pentapeptide repeats
MTIQGSQPITARADATDKPLVPRYQPKPQEDITSGLRKVYREHRPAVLLWSSLALILLIAFVFCLYLLPRLLIPTPDQLPSLKGKERVDAEIALAAARNGVRTPLIQAVAGLAFLITAFLAWRQVLVARRGQQVETFAKSIEQLGNDKDDVRLGGIYALEQLSRDDRYTRPVAEVFAAYVRTHSGPDIDTKSGSSTGQSALGNPVRGTPIGQSMPAQPVTPTKREPKAAVDVQAVAEILVSGGLWARATQEPLDLSDTSLRGARLPYARLREAILYRCNLSQTDLAQADLYDADIRDSNLEGSRLKGADLSRAWLNRSDLTRASLEEAKAYKGDFQEAKLAHAILSGAEFLGADLTDCNISEALASSTIFRDAVLTRANMTGASLPSADFRGAVMADAVLRDTDVEDADFSNADLRGTDFTGARNIDSANFEAADLKGVIGLPVHKTSTAETSKQRT